MLTAACTACRSITSSWCRTQSCGRCWSGTGTKYQLFMMQPLSCIVALGSFVAPRLWRRHALQHSTPKWLLHSLTQLRKLTRCSQLYVRTGQNSEVLMLRNCHSTPRQLDVSGSCKFATKPFLP